MGYEHAMCRKHTLQMSQPAQNLAFESRQLHECRSLMSVTYLLSGDASATGVNCADAILPGKNGPHHL